MPRTRKIVDAETGELLDDASGGVAVMERPQTTAVTNWDEELAKQAEAAAAAEPSAGGKFFSMKAGQLTFNDAPLPHNQMAVVIVDGIFENVYYEGRYDAANPAPPACYAYGRDDKGMEPHEQVKALGTAQNDVCQGCQWNEWGSADTGKGKACRNTRRLALIPAGDLIDEAGREFEAYEEPEAFGDAEFAYMKLPVTSVKGYAAYVKKLALTVKRPPHAVFTRIRVVPDERTQFRVEFDALGPVPNHLMNTIMERHQESRRTIDFPYPEPSEAPAPQARGRQAPAPRGRSAAIPPQAARTAQTTARRPSKY